MLVDSPSPHYRYDIPVERRFPKALAIAALLLTVVGIFIASPFYSAYSLFQGVEQRDLEAVKNGIDFPALRESLKEQLNARMADTVSNETKGNVFAALGGMFAGALVDRMVDMIVTPQGILN